MVLSQNYWNKVTLTKIDNLESVMTSCTRSEFYKEYNITLSTVEMLFIWFKFVLQY